MDNTRRQAQISGICASHSQRPMNYHYELLEKVHQSSRTKSGSILFPHDTTLVMLFIELYIWFCAAAMI